MNELDLLRAWAPGDDDATHEGGALETARAALADAMSEDDVAVITTVRSTPRRFVGRAVVAAAVTIALALGGVVMLNRVVDNRIDHVKRLHLPAGTLDPSKVTYPMTILVVGSDSRRFVSTPEEAQTFGSAVDAAGQRSDVMILVRLLADRTDAVWLPRDLMVADGAGGSRQLNSYFDRGPQALIEAVKTNLAVPVDHYVQVDFSAFIKVVDAVGGVRMAVPDRVRDTFSGLSLDAQQCVNFNGDQALALVRSRHLERFDGVRWTDASGAGDLGRIERQQRFVGAVLAQMKAAVADDPTRALDISDAVVRSLTVDASMTRDAVRALVSRFAREEPSSWTLSTVPVMPDPNDRNRLTLTNPGADVFPAPTPTSSQVPPPPPGPRLGDAC